MGRRRTVFDRNEYSKQHYAEAREKEKEINERIKNAPPPPRGRWDCDFCCKPILSKTVYITSVPKKQYHYWCFKLRGVARAREPLRFVREAPYRLGMAGLRSAGMQLSLLGDVARAEGDD